MIETKKIIPFKIIAHKIYTIRGLSVMIDADLAELYGVQTKRLNEQVKRNLGRFPKDFMFQLNQEEKDWLIENAQGLARLKFSTTLPLAFTEHGAVMLASVLNSQRAVEVNVQIVRIFIKIRETILSHQHLLLEMEDIKKLTANHDEQIQLIFDYISKFNTNKTETKKRKIIGFNSNKN